MPIVLYSNNKVKSSWKVGQFSFWKISASMIWNQIQRINRVYNHERRQLFTTKSFVRFFRFAATIASLQNEFQETREFFIFLPREKFSSGKITPCTGIVPQFQFSPKYTARDGSARGSKVCLIKDDVFPLKSRVAVTFINIWTLYIGSYFSLKKKSCSIIDHFEAWSLCFQTVSFILF